MSRSDVMLKSKYATHRPQYPPRFLLLVGREPKLPLWRRLLRAVMGRIK